jgi:hypothetical protein
VHRDSEVRKREIQSAELLVRDPNPVEIEIAVAKLERYQSPSTDQISVGTDFSRR